MTAAAPLRKSAGVRINSTIDLSDAGRPPSAAGGRTPCVDILVNNAGVALGGTFEQTAGKVFRMAVRDQFLGRGRMTRLPPCTRARKRIVSLSSLFA
jgi:NADP-dependent 3-hydroxy acid dehydrogenase YdfG